MNPETLKKTLAALHEELSQARALDERSRQLLHEIMRDIETLGPSPSSAEHPPSDLGPAYDEVWDGRHQLAT